MTKDMALLLSGLNSFKMNATCASLIGVGFGVYNDKLPLVDAPLTIAQFVCGFMMCFTIFAFVMIGLYNVMKKDIPWTIKL